MDFEQWFNKKWQENNGLLTQITAAKLLNLSPARIYTLRKDGKIRAYTYEKTLYISRADVDKLVIYYKEKRRIEKAIRKIKI